MAEIAIVGGGPSGAMCGEQLARAGHKVQIFDERLAWEKPCGGGLTHKAVQCFPFLLDNPYPKKLVRSVELISSNDQRANLEMTHPIVIYSRRVLERHVAGPRQSGRLRRAASACSWRRHQHHEAALLCRWRMAQR